MPCTELDESTRGSTATVTDELTVCQPPYPRGLEANDAGHRVLGRQNVELIPETHTRKTARVAK